MKIQKFIVVLSFVLLFWGTFSDFASRPLFDFDFWWHISTGRYIVETHKIPETDPFSFVSELPENKNLFPERGKFILKQYWLAQVFFYLIYNFEGPKGIIILRALLLTSLLLLVLYRLRKWEVSFYICFVFIFLLFVVASRHVGERPVLFTILFTPLTFIILEKFKEGQKKFLFLLPPLMLLWSNLHGGFIIGIVIIFVFMLVEGFKIIVMKVGYSRNEIILFYVITMLALVFSHINPTGWDAFSIALSPEYKFMEEGVQEYASPFYIYQERLYPINYGAVALLSLLPLILIARNKKMDLTHIILLLGFFAMALKTSRYDIYYSTMACMILGKETDMLLNNLFKKKIPDRIYTKMMSALGIFTLLSSILFVFGVSRSEAFNFRLATAFSVPRAAVDFIEENRIKGNMLNDAGFGGYITWRLYPWKKTFTDTRWLNYTTKVELYWVLNSRDSIKNNKIVKGKMPLWERLLEHYDVNIVLTSIFDIYGQVVNLIFTLAEDEKWVPVFSDPISIVFIKNIPENHDIITKYKLTKECIYNMIICRASLFAERNTQNPKYLLSIGQTFYKMGRLKEALTAYKYALARNPHKELVRKKIEDIEAELKGQSKNERD